MVQKHALSGADPEFFEGGLTLVQKKLTTFFSRRAAYQSYITIKLTNYQGSEAILKWGPN